MTANQKKTTLRIDEKILAEVVTAALREALKRESPFHYPAAKA